MSKYYVILDGDENRKYETNLKRDAINYCRKAIEEQQAKVAELYTEGKSFPEFYRPKPRRTIRHTRPHLIKNGANQLCFEWKANNKTRNDYAIYNIEKNELLIADKKVDKHPKFKDVDKFESFVSRYFADGKDGYDPGI